MTHVVKDASQSDHRRRRCLCSSYLVPVHRPSASLLLTHCRDHGGTSARGPWERHAASFCHPLSVCSCLCVLPYFTHTRPLPKSTSRLPPSSLLASDYSPLCCPDEVGLNSEPQLIAPAPDVSPHQQPAHNINLPDCEVGGCVPVCL